MGSDLSELRATLASSPGALVVAAFLTAILYMETRRALWAPFFIIFGTLSLTVPWAAGRMLPFAAGAFTERTAPILAGFAALALWEHGICTGLYEKIVLRRYGRDRDPFHCPSATLGALTRLAAERHGIPLRRAEILFGIYVLGWAPLGENLLYWGYLAPSLEPTTGWLTAVAVTAAFFAVRHGIHFLYLRNPVPWPSLAAFSLSAFGSAAIMGWLARATESLAVLIAVQMAGNLVWIILLSADRGDPR